MSNGAPSERLITTRDAARSLTVSPRTIARWVERGWVEPEMTLPSGHHRFFLSKVEQQLRDQR